MRVVGIDLGTRRIGVAVSDPTGTLASPYEVVQRSGDPAADHRAIARIVQDVEAERVVVGLPLSMNGRESRGSLAARDEAAAMEPVVGVPVEVFDERLTTVSADRSLMAMRMKADARRRVVDKVAAAVMLQAWLDGGRR